MTNNAFRLLIAFAALLVIPEQTALSAPTNDSTVGHRPQVLTNPLGASQTGTSGLTKPISLDKEYGHLQEAPKGLPFLPQIADSNAKFMFGLKKPESRGGSTGLYLAYQSKEAPADVSQYYKQMLTANNWTISKSDGFNISAVQKGCSISVQISRGRIPGYATDFHINYNMRDQ